MLCMGSGGLQSDASEPSVGKGYQGMKRELDGLPVHMSCANSRSARLAGVVASQVMPVLCRQAGMC